jgi:hypothetical protein
MAASKSIREALNTLNDELLTAKPLKPCVPNLHGSLKALPPSTPALAVFMVVTH